MGADLENSLREWLILNKLLSFLFSGVLVSASTAACTCCLKTLEDSVGDADSIHIATLQQTNLNAGEYVKNRPNIDGVFKV